MFKTIKERDPMLVRFILIIIVVIPHMYFVRLFDFWIGYETVNVPMTSDNFDVSPDGDLIMALDSPTRVLTIADLEGNVVEKTTLPITLIQEFESSRYGKFEQLQWFQGQLASFQINKSIYTFDLDSKEIVKIYTAERTVDHYCWASNGMILYTSELTEEFGRTLKQMNFATRKWSSYEVKEYAYHLACDQKTSDVLFPTGTVYSYDEVENIIYEKTQYNQTNRASQLAGFDSTKHHFISTKYFGRSRPTCIYFHSYQGDSANTLISKHSWVGKLAYSAKTQTLFASKHSTLYKIQLNFADDGKLIPPDLVLLPRFPRLGCNHN